MSATIVQYTISSAADNFVQLANSRFARPLPFSTTWNAIRIALRATMVDGGTISGTPKFAIGVCNGSTNIYGDASPTAYCGGTNTGAWTRIAPNLPSTPFQYRSSSFLPTFRYGATENTGTDLVGANNWTFQDATSSAIRSAIFLDITRGSPNYTFRMFYRSNVGTDVTTAALEAQLLAATPSLTSHSFGSAQTLAVDTTHGDFDHVNIYWDQTAAKMEFSDIYIVRFS